MSKSSNKAAGAPRAGRRYSKTDALFERALALHRAGQFPDAEDLYNRILSIFPSHGGAIVNLGQIHRQRGDVQQAVALYRQAATLPDASAVAFSNLGNALVDQGALAEAKAAYEKAVTREPSLVVAQERLAKVLLHEGDAVGAIRHLDDAARVQPLSDGARQTLLKAYVAAGRFSESLALIDDEAENGGDEMIAAQMTQLMVIGRAAERSSQPHHAARAYERAFRRCRNNPDAGALLARIKLGLGDEEGALEVLVGAVRANGDLWWPHFNLGYGFRTLHRYNASLAELRTAAELAPDNPVVGTEMAVCLALAGRHDEAFERFQGILTTDRGRQLATSGYLAALLYNPRKSAVFLSAEHRTRAADGPPPAAAAAVMDRRPGERLRVGYLLPDAFRNNPTSQFLLPLLSAHLRLEVDSIVYSHTLRPMPVNGGTGFPGDLRFIGDRDNAAVCEMIASDRLDLLIDVAGHGGGQGLQIMAARPAPRQACFIGYPFTTGAPGVDFLLTDAAACPAQDEELYTERVIRLPPSFLCFSPPDGMPPAKPKGAGASVVLGSLNRWAKISERTVDLWARVLREIRMATLFVKCAAFVEEETQAACVRAFDKRGVDPCRLYLEGPSPFTQTMQRYESIDIALDTVPYNGATSTCQALWMGTPVITLAGRGVFARLGASLLTAAGHPEWICYNEAAYVDAIRNRVRDRLLLQQESDSLMATLPASPLCAMDSYAQAVLEAYRTMAAATVPAAAGLPTHS